MDFFVIFIFAILAFIILCICSIYIKWIAEVWCYGRRRDSICLEDLRRRREIEMLPPTYDEAIKTAGTEAVRRRSNQTVGPVNLNADDVNETPLNREACTHDDSGNGGNRDDSGVTSNLGEDVEVSSSSKVRRASKFNSPDDSGIQSTSGNDTDDKFDDLSSKYDTASENSAGGGDSLRAPSPWIDF
ncbi:uncharacterized protein [Choristoneura fumiferana]|uniref:uncharacterized protein n=1 Tax=Choristoneura fumiferana TaxID=7141 RepID=UPI003D1560B0